MSIFKKEDGQKMVEYRLKTPISEEDVRKLNIGDVVYITGKIYGARDQAHRRILEYVDKGLKIPVDLNGSVIFHVGPIVKKQNDKWTVISAGPTTSTRMNITTPKLLENFAVRIIIGKGGMSKEVVEALKRRGAVYCHFTGGAGVLATKAVKNVEGVDWLDLGVPEALWRFEVENFGPVIVTIDSKGRSIYETVEKSVEKNLEKIYQQIG
ncbi:MAG: FumA C-terminus/TtdB family hydratase beta subunit [Candidatus Bathyarchaeota archaeon]|nr:FumA C-terminus/TtdB family hydratase beta subunit [Candidatus Bathyarchaeota archaeon]